MKGYNSVQGQIYTKVSTRVKFIYNSVKVAFRCVAAYIQTIIDPAAPLFLLTVESQYHKAIKLYIPRFKYVN